MSYVVNNQRFKFIDGLRGIAALSVVLFHLNVAIQKHAPHAFPYYLDQLFSVGYLGVQIFFVLSGFVIAYSLRHAQIDSSFFMQFFIRRSLRLDPPYWVVIMLTLLLAGLASLTFKSGSDFPFSSLQIFYNLFYLPDLMQVPLIVPVAWTLCIEFQFYIIFAWLLMGVQRIQKNSIVLIMWGGLSLFSILQNTPWAFISAKPLTFIPYWYSFFLGCSACWALIGKNDKRIFFLNILIVTLCSYWTHTPHALVSIGTAFLIYLEGGENVLLKERFFQYLGSRSYSLYLIHWPVGMKFVDTLYKISSMEHPLLVDLLFLASLALILVTADLFYRLIERPSHAFSRRFRGELGSIF